MYNELYNLFSLHEGKLFLQVDPPGGIYSQLSLRQRDTLGDGTMNYVRLREMSVLLRVN